MTNKMMEGGKDGECGKFNFLSCLACALKDSHVLAEK